MLGNWSGSKYQPHLWGPASHCAAQPGAPGQDESEPFDQIPHLTFCGAVTGNPRPPAPRARKGCSAGWAPSSHACSVLSLRILAPSFVMFLWPCSLSSSRPALPRKTIKNRTLEPQQLVLVAGIATYRVLTPHHQPGSSTYTIPFTTQTNPARWRSQMSCSTSGH